MGPSTARSKSPSSILELAWKYASPTLRPPVIATALSPMKTCRAFDS